MKQIIVFSSANNQYNLVISNEIKFMNDKEYSHFINYDLELDKDIISIEVYSNLLISLLSLLDLIEFKKVKVSKTDADSRFILIQNENKNKLIIDQFTETYIVTNLKSETNEEDFALVPNSVFDAFTSAVRVNNYKFIKEPTLQVETLKKLCITKDEVLNNLDEIIRNRKYDLNTIFERYDYFDINLIKKYYVKFYNKEISETDFSSFNYLMMLLMKYMPKSKDYKVRQIYIYLFEYFDGLAFGIDHNDKTSITSSFAHLKYLYNEIHNIKNEEVLIYYNDSYYNEKHNTELFEIAILDNKHRKYWMGFINNPIFDFDTNCIECFLHDYLKYECIADDDGDDFLSYCAFDYIPLELKERYRFDESLRDKYFINNKYN